MKILLKGKSNKELGCNLCKLSKKEHHARTRIRFLGLCLIQKGKTYREVAASLDVFVSTVQDWVNKFREFGPEGLKEKKGTGRKPILPRDKEEELKKLISEEQKNRTGGRLILEDIKVLVENHFKVKYSIPGLCHMLHRIGLVWISSRSRHPNTNKENQDAFKKTSKVRFQKSSHQMLP